MNITLKNVIFPSDATFEICDYVDHGQCIGTTNLCPPCFHDITNNDDAINRTSSSTTTTSTLHSSQTIKTCTFIEDTDYRGVNNTQWHAGNDMTKEECCHLCQTTRGCDFSVLSGTTGACWFKTNGAVPYYRKGDISCCPFGVNGCPSSPENNDKWYLQHDFSDEFQSTKVIGQLMPINRTKWTTNVTSWSNDWSWSNKNVRIVQNPNNESSNNNNGEVTGSFIALDMTYEPHVNDKNMTVYYNSGILKSMLPRGIQYGRFEARIKGAGRWPGVCPAFWGWRRTSSKSIKSSNDESYWIELDFVEMLENKNTVKDIDFTSHVFPPTKGLPNPKKELSNATHWIAPFDPRDDFHIYSMEWNSTLLTWYVDGILVKKENSFPYFNGKDRYIDIALSFGLRPPLKTLSNKTDFPTTFYVDWIRTWKRKEL